MSNKYYVYIHTNPLTRVPFYIGKGCGRRAYSKSGRNNYWKNIVNKHGIEVTILEDGLTDKQAFYMEISLIKRLGRRDLGTGVLVNMSDGGEGGEGKSNKGRKHSEETKKKMSEAQKGKIVSQETRNKLSKSQKGRKNMLGKIHSDETRKKMSESAKGDKNQFKGKTHSEESRKKMSEARKGRKMSEETKKKLSESKLNMSDETKNKMSESMKGNKNCLGRKLSDEHIAKLREGHKLYWTNKNLNK